MGWDNLLDDIATEFLVAQDPLVSTIERVRYKRAATKKKVWQVGRNGHAYPLHPSALVVACKNPECGAEIHNAGGHRGKSYCNSKCCNRASYIRLNRNNSRRSRAYAPAVAVALRGDQKAYRFPDTGINLSLAVETLQMTLISAALKRSQGNKAKAANLLSVKRTTLVEMLKRLQRK